MTMNGMKNMKFDQKKLKEIAKPRPQEAIEREQYQLEHSGELLNALLDEVQKEQYSCYDCIHYNYNIYAGVFHSSVSQVWCSKNNETCKNCKDYKPAFYS